MVGPTKRDGLPEKMGTVEEASKSEASGTSTETATSTKKGTPAEKVESADGESSEGEKSSGSVSPLGAAGGLSNGPRERRSGAKVGRPRRSRADHLGRAAVEPILAKAILLRMTSEAARKPREAAESFFSSLAQETGEDPAALIVGLREAVGVRRSTQRNICKFVVSHSSWCRSATSRISQNGLRRRSSIACTAVDASNS